MTYKIITADKLLAGDLLLCYSPQLKGTDDELKWGYAHVALCGDEGKPFEASDKGVRETTVQKLLAEYEHLAIVRASCTWSADRVSKLSAFLQAQVDKPFNPVGMFKVTKRKKTQEGGQIERIRAYFEGSATPPPSNRSVYFCSELVVAAFIEAGIIKESASMVMPPELYSPEGLAHDKAFGFFYGYIVRDDAYKIPGDDYFKTSI